MKEIKFRAWNTRKPYGNEQLKEMAYFELTDLDEDYIIPSGTYLEGDFNIMQYTGLKDKNSKEIYEGDIVAYQGYPELPLSVASVEWNNERARFIIRWQDGQSHLGHDTFDRAEYLIGYEVIGNIYENPELLEKQ